MRNRLKTVFKLLVISSLLAVGALSGEEALAQKQQKITVQNENVRDDNLDDMSFVEMINSVEIDGKSADLIRKFQDKEGRNRLHNREYNSQNGCTVETYRNKEVLLVTIPASQLFMPNETTLRPGAAALLNPIKRYLKDTDMYRVLMVMHTDNTGSEAYRDNITEARAEAVFDWFRGQHMNTKYLFPYAYGDEMPLVENNTMENRDKNRRLEIYLMPGRRMVEQAQKGRIVF